MASTAFQLECRRLQAGVILEKCRHQLLISGPSDPTWRWCAEYVSKYGESASATATTINGTLVHESRPIEARPLSERVRAVRDLIAAQTAKN